MPLDLTSLKKAVSAMAQTIDRAEDTHFMNGQLLERLEQSND